MIFFVVIFFIGVPAGLLERILTTRECECGIEMGSYRTQSLLNRIINGEEVQPHRFPWVVFVISCYQVNKCFDCGAAIINNLYILTAGHCVYSSDYKEITSNINVVVGAHISNEGGLVLKGQSVILHPKYNDDGGDGPYNDIALIKLQKPLQYSKKIKPICLPKGYKSYADSYAFVAGWGKTESGENSKRLMHTMVEITSDEFCKRQWNIEVSENICAYKYNTGSCKGDSGGAVFTPIAPHTYEVIGIVSFGDAQCDVINKASVYTRVTTYLKWIYDNTKDALYCHNPTGY